MAAYKTKFPRFLRCQAILQLVLSLLALLSESDIRWHAYAFFPSSASSRRLSYPCFQSKEVEVPEGLMKDIRSIAEKLWGGSEQLNNLILSEASSANNLLSGESPFSGTNYCDRATLFESKAKLCDPQAQHSLGLLLWSGFCVEKDEIASAQWHAAAAAQNHFDGMAVLGGCLRTGTGVTKNVELGLRLIEYSATQQNPTGVNKKAALEESNSNYHAAFQLYEKCIQTSQPNALLFMNLGWCLMEGEGTLKDVKRGEEMWRKAAEMAPDEGSEEAAWFLYRHYLREDEKEAQKWLQLAAALGYDEALGML
jgi:TPR repeat protein